MTATVRRTAMALVLVAAVTFAILQLTPASEPDFGLTRTAMAEYQTTAAAEEAGWVLLPDLDHCFADPASAGAMGYHHINPDLMDTVVDPVRPESIVYAPDADGNRRLAAVEWIVPGDAWAGAGNDGPPEVLGEAMHFNDGLGVWVLHAWIFLDNPGGVMADWNPSVTCDA